MPTTMSKRQLHADPPMTPASFLLPRPRLIAGLAVLLVILAVAAAIDHGALLLTWDEPIQRVVESSRNGFADWFFRTTSRLGSTVAVLSIGPLLALVTWRRCRSVSLAIVVAMLSRPLLEFVLKAIVGRARPDFDRLVPGNGHSFPSGHVMAAVALWGLVPMIVPLFTRRRGLWWASVFASGALIVAISASRVYLGVHWFSDVAGGLVVGVFFLLGVEHVFGRLHRRHPCGAMLLAPPAEEPAGRAEGPALPADEPDAAHLVGVHH